jgi:hypothetical protein
MLPNPSCGQNNLLRLLFDKTPSLTCWAICAWKALQGGGCLGPVSSG